MTIRTDYVLIGLMAVVLLWVLYLSRGNQLQFDKYEKVLQGLQDSIGQINQSRKTDSLRIESLKVTVDSIKTAKQVVIRRATHERTVIRNASADSLATIVRSGLDSLQR